MDDQSTGRKWYDGAAIFFLFLLGIYKGLPRMLLQKTNQQQFSIIYNLIYSETPLIRSPMGQKKIGCINGVSVLSGQGQILRLEGRTDKYIVQHIRISMNNCSH